MSLTPWTRALGSQQGRVPPANTTPPDGDYVFVLGHDEPGRREILQVGDYADASQYADFEGAEIARVKLRLRPPEEMPDDTAWVFSILVDGNVHALHTLTPGRTRDRVDMGAVVSVYGPGGHELAFRLELTGAATDYQDVELPGVFVDDITLETTADEVILINRDAEPGETGVPQGSNVQLDIASLVGGYPDETATQVYVDSVLAFDNGVFQTGFDGPASAYTFPVAGVLRIVIDPTTLFESLATIPVQVVSEAGGGGSTIDETYQFTIEDKTPPTLVAAQAREAQRIRLSFSEAMLQVSSAGASDALNPANYVLTALTAPAVSLVVESVEEVSTTSVDLITDIEMTPGATYQVEVNDAVDLFDNVIVPPDNDATFEGFECPHPEGRDFEIYDFWPEMNRQEDDGSLRLISEVFQEVLDLTLCEVDRCTDELDPDLAREKYVDRMLRDLGNPFTFSFDLELVDKRRLITVLFPIYNQKGTAIGVKNAIRFFLNLEVEIDAFNATGMELGESELGGDEGEDWELNPSLSFQRFSFVVVSPVTLTEDQRHQITSIVNYMKPAHTHFVRLDEPDLSVPYVPEHVELGESVLGDDEWDLH